MHIWKKRKTKGIDEVKIDINTKTREVHKQIEEVASMMKDALTSHLKEKKNLTNLQQQTDALRANALQFNKRATVLKNYGGKTLRFMLQFAWPF